MDSFDQLYEYQTIDVEVDRLEYERKRSPMRLNLVKKREYVVEQQNIIRRIENDVAMMTDRMDALRDAIARAQEQLRGLQQRLEGDAPNDSEGVQAFILDTQKICSNISAYESEIAKIRKDSNDREKQDHDVRLRAAKVIAEFNKLKAEYDVVYQEQNREIEALRAKADEKAAAIDPEWMRRYREIKMHSVPPLAKLAGDKCGGCNMSLPSAVVRGVKGGTPTECENCGRLIIGQ